jgi:hypothetical protein
VIQGLEVRRVLFRSSSAVVSARSGAIFGKRRKML